MNEENIRKQAKALMDEFINALEGAEEVNENIGVERKHNTREASECELAKGFPERMLKNAPSKKDRYVAAEKKKW